MGDGTEPKAEQQRSIVLDFDGTVTESDLLDRTALEFGDPAVYQEVEDGPRRRPPAAPRGDRARVRAGHCAARGGRRVGARRGAGPRRASPSSCDARTRGRLGRPRRLERVRGADRARPRARRRRGRAAREPRRRAARRLARRVALPGRLRRLRRVVQAFDCSRRARSSTSATATPTAAPRSPPTASSRRRGLARYLAEQGTPFEPFTDFHALSEALAAI